MISQVKIFNTIDGRQAIVYSTTLRNGSTSYSDAPVFYEKATAQISILTFKEDLIQTFEPVILFEINTMLGVILKVDECQASFNAQNNVCFIRILHANGTLYKSILFSTAGSVIKIENLKNFGSENSNIIVSDESTLIPFLYGGYILVNSINNINVGYIYDENGNNIRELDIPEIYKNSGNIYRSGVLSINNTAWMLLDNSSIGWSLATFETPQELNKAQFQNPLITSLIPSLNQQINKNEILNTNLSSDVGSLRTTRRSFSIEEPLSGINKGFWKVTTNQLTEPNKIAESTTGTLQLTTFGTSYYNNFSSSAEKDEFKNALQNQLCDSIPINQSRFRMSGKLLPDTRKKDQLLIEFKILSTQDKYEPNVESIINDLNTIIKNKEIVLPLNLSNLIDQEYGFVQASNIWEENKFILLGLGIALLIFCLIYLWARRRNSEGNNFALIQAVMIWFDLTMDILFIVKNGHDVEKLYIPSVIVLAVSIIFNVISAFKLFTYELKNNEKFLEWFIGNAKLASIFTILSSADVGALSILNSRFGGFELFNSSLSLKTQKKIFYGTTANLFIEDIPQLTIQILYRMNVITYSTIPLLSLITSSILVASDVLSRTYNLISGLYFIHKKKEPKDSNESDLPEVLID
ncbi:unnamed protein product [Rhizophagus irregularis]|nr:unnamed protein product [Rhizophagus irregularis]CAB5311411.1 unnamed protein product [Rhizophagus irregularis]